MNFLEFHAPYPHGACETSINKAFVELYDDTGWTDRSIVLDYADRLAENVENFDRFEGFEDKASSARWCIPPGWRLRLYEDKSPCGGSTRDLTGRGGMNLGPVGWGDEVSCVRWIRD